MVSAVYTTMAEYVEEVKRIIASSSITDDEIKKCFARYLLQGQYGIDTNNLICPKIIDILIPANTREYITTYYIHNIASMWYTTSEGGRLDIERDFYPNTYEVAPTFLEQPNKAGRLQACAIFADKMLFDYVVPVDTVVSFRGDVSPCSFRTDFSTQGDTVINNIPDSVKIAVLQGSAKYISEVKFLNSKIENLTLTNSTHTAGLRAPKLTNRSSKRYGSKCVW